MKIRDYGVVSTTQESSSILQLMSKSIHFGLRTAVRSIGPALCKRAARRYLASHSSPRINLGCGSHILEGWFNTDFFPKWYLPQYRGVAYQDVSRPFPFDSQTFDYVYSEHMIEHLPLETGLAMLEECHRVLKPGGKIRIATPDLDNLVGLCNEERSEEQEHYLHQSVDVYWPGCNEYSPAFVLNQFLRDWGHQFVYDAATLSASMEKVGFTEARRYAPGDSDDEQLRGIERHGEEIGEELNRFETMVLEAIRP